MLSDLVARAAKMRPTGIAFRDHIDSVSFADAERQTAQLAGVLQANGVGVEDRVAICMPAAILSAICVHGVFRAGGAFVPVDPEAPAERIRAILSDCGIRHILSVPSLQSKIAAATSGIEIDLALGVREPWDMVWASPATFDAPSRDPEQLAYIMYTSGSTGTPKGIAHTHRSGLAYVTHSAETYAVSEGSVIATSGPLHFDIATFAYLTAPAMAATSVIVPQAVARMPASMAQLIEKTGVTIFYTTASGVVALVDRGALDKRDMSQLSWLIFCGEPMPPVPLARAMQALPHVWFSNSYGPAEVNQCTFHHLAPGTALENIVGQVPIGTVWRGANHAILDTETQAPGAKEGELVVSSATMMREYWHRPDLNSKAFYQSDAGETFYRTGDIVRADETGALVLVGRVDRQIKVRGYRVELDEVELHLSGHPSVGEAAAFPVRRDDNSVLAIRAAVLRKDGAKAQPETLRSYLEQRLPSYAIPAEIDVRSALPRTSSGKIDRRALEMDASAALQDAKEDGA